jgi:hypothetical protein
LARIAIRSLYRQDMRAIGRKFLASEVSSFLWIRMVVAVFHSVGTSLARKQWRNINLVPRAFPFLSLGRREKALAPGGHMTFNTQI